MAVAHLIFRYPAAILHYVDHVALEQYVEYPQDARPLKGLYLVFNLDKAYGRFGGYQRLHHQYAVGCGFHSGPFKQLQGIFLVFHVCLIIIYLRIYKISLSPPTPSFPEFATWLRLRFATFVYMELIHSLLYMLNEMSPYILLGFLIAGALHAFIPQQTFARHLSGTGWKAVVKAAAVGVPLPLCSCGVLPTAIAMRRNGASRAASTSFLVATPQTGVDSIAATWSLLGPAFAVVRPVAALFTAMFGGLIVGRSERGEAVSVAVAPDAVDERPHGFFPRLAAALRYGFVDLVGSIGGWLVAGLIIAALITVYVPADFFSVFGSRPLLSMIAVLVIAVPMYVCATGSIPIALSLVMKGLSPGTALVLLMAGPAANFASFTLISREMGRKAAALYLLSIVGGAILFGLAVDYLLPASWFDLAGKAACANCHHGYGLFATICSALLVALLLYSFIKRIFTKSTITSNMTKEYIIKGMNCPHCQASVAKSIAAVEGVENVDVNLSAGIATVEGTHNPAILIEAVRAAGFDAAEK